MNKSWNKSAYKRNPVRKITSFASGNCHLCGKRLVNRINSQTHEPFVGCSGYPLCKYIVHIEKDRIDYVAESFPNGWKPNYPNDIFPLIEKCASRPEIEYLFGAAYYLDFECGLSEKPHGLSLYKTSIVYSGSFYEAIRFEDPFVYWGGGFPPSAMAFVPQLVFAENYHHDFGIFFAGKHSASSTDWWLELAVEVDVHPEHRVFPNKDLYRDSLVKYPVLRLKPKIDDPLTWFKRVKLIWDNNKSE